jgi:hypothetical protein
MEAAVSSETLPITYQTTETQDTTIQSRSTRLDGYFDTTNLLGPSFLVYTRIRVTVGTLVRLSTDKCQDEYKCRVEREQKNVQSEIQTLFDRWADQTGIRIEYYQLYSTGAITALQYWVHLYVAESRSHSCAS